MHHFSFCMWLSDNLFTNFNIWELPEKTRFENNCKKLNIYGVFPELLKLRWNLVVSWFFKYGSFHLILTGKNILLEFRPEFLKNSADVCFSDKISTVESYQRKLLPILVARRWGFQRAFWSEFLVGEAVYCGILIRFLSEFT